MRACLMRISLGVWLILLSACVSGSKRLTQIEEARTTPLKLENLCQEAVTGACALLGKDVVRSHVLPILQSVTSATQSRFAVVVPKNERFTYYVRSTSSPNIARLEPTRIVRDFSSEAVDQIEAFGLNTHTSYELLVLDSGANLWDRRQFNALDTSKKSPRIALVSCMDDKLLREQAVMWKQLMNQAPDVIVMMGDNVYADRLPNGWQVADAEQLWTRYVQTRELLEIFKAPKLIPVFATWDDHDFGRNDSDRTYAFKDESLKVFQSFFVQDKPSENFARGPGVSSLWDAYGIRFALLDDRSFRSPKGMDLPDQTHFGADQENWIADFLKSSKRPVFLISGDQFFGGYQKFESYQGNHPKNFSQQLKRWKHTAVPVVFLSGDRHLTEIIKVGKEALGFPTFELTSSPIHAKVFADAFLKDPSPHQLRGAGAAGEYNYMLVQLLDVRKNKVELDVQSFGPDMKLLFQKKLMVKR